VRTKTSRRVGLARALSKLGYCSRSRAAELIRSGRVRLNGATQRNPETPTVADRDKIEVDGDAVGAERKVYWMLNKPRGMVTTASDEKGRQTVYTLLPKELPWLAPVGRLDKASEGLLLFTNDSEWGARIASPETDLDKTYHVQVDGVLAEDFPQQLVKGMREASGELLRAKSAGILRRGEKKTWLVIVLDEGKNRQIRRMLDHSGIDVLRLIRVAIGPLPLGELAKGSCRALTEGEKRSLNAALHLP
jgi:23S rRNA pseudouridine2605 synthase